MSLTADLLIHARWIVTVETDGEVLADHALAIRDGKIVAIVPPEGVAAVSAKETVRLPRHVLMPGLVNLHCHAAMTLLRGYADDLALMDWLQNHIWPAEGKHVSDEFVYDGTLIGMAEMIRSGTTTVNDMYFYNSAVARAGLAAGMRTFVGCSILEFPTNYGLNADDYINKGLKERDEFVGESMVTFTLAPHAPYTVSDATFRKVVTLAEQLDLPIHCHIHETQDEINGSLSEHQVRPLARLAALGLLSPRLVAAHMVHLNDEEIALAAHHGVSVAHNPTSNMKLASGIAHELRTPLTSIRGFVQYLKEGGSQAEWEEYGTIMIREIDRLNRIINQMLQFARPHPLNTGLLNANELVEETLLLINTIPSDKHVTLCFDLAPHLPPLQADGGQIKQVLLNLVVNAIQSMKEGQAGIITIKTFLSPSQMIGIEIADQGCGIAEAHLERIFDPFYSTKAEGTGLGLAVAKRIIEEHSGQLDVSSHLGKGTSITLLLPCAAASRE